MMQLKRDHLLLEGLYIELFDRFVRANYFAIFLSQKMLQCYPFYDRTIYCLLPDVSCSLK